MRLSARPGGKGPLLLPVSGWRGTPRDLRRRLRFPCQSHATRAVLAVSAPRGARASALTAGRPVPSISIKVSRAPGLLRLLGCAAAPGARKDRVCAPFPASDPGGRKKYPCSVYTNCEAAAFSRFPP
ncbi:hypothetical protein MRX96_054540 [Rhipicephalus microplus]